MSLLRNTHPILFGTLPILLVYTNNAGELHPGQLVRPVVATVAFSTVSYALFLSWFRAWSVAAPLASLWVLLVLSFGHGANLLVSTSGLALTVARWIVAVVFGALLLTVARLGWRAKRTHGSWAVASLPLFSVAVLLVVLQIGRIGWMELQSAPAPRAGAPERAASVDTMLPDIYFILLDGYGRTDVLRDMYDFDNSDFIEQLRDWGFHVADHSYANYVGTRYTMASIFNMDYVQNIAQLDPALKHTKPLVGLIRSNRVVHELRQRGYRIIALASGYPAGEFGHIDDYLEVPRALSDFEQLLVQTTPLPWIWKHQIDAHDMHRRRLRWILQQIPSVPDAAQPRFVFAHLLAPHPPFVFDRNGNDLPTPELFALNDGSHWLALGTSEEDYRRLYAEQARWVTEQIRPVLQSLLENSAKPPVIVVMSDHGPGSQLNCDELGNTNLHERFAILTALYLPGVNVPRLGSHVAPVNLFRLLSDLYFGTNFGLCPAKSFYSAAPTPFLFIEITDSLPRLH